MTITVPKGKYYISSHLRICSNTYLKLSSSAQIIRKNDSDFIMISGESGTGYSGLKNVTINGGIWDGNVSDTTKSHGLIKINNAKNIKVANATFKNVCGTHFVLFTGVANLTVKKCTLKNFIHYTGTASSYKSQTDADLAYRGAEALHIDYVVKDSSTGESGTPCKNVTISNCTFSKVTSGIGTHHVYSYMNASNITIKNNTFKNCYFYCVNTAGFTDFTMSNNTATNIAGLIYAEATEGTVKNNTITAKKTLSGKMYKYDTFSSSTPTLNVSRFSDSTVKFYNNTIKNSSANCVYACEDSNITVQRCKLTNATNAGVGLNDATVKLIETTIGNSGSNGVTLKNGSSITAKKNYIYKSTENAFYIADKSKATITDNSHNDSGKNDLSLSDKSTGIVFKNNGSNVRKTYIPSDCSATVTNLKKSLRSYKFTIDSSAVYTGKQIKPTVTTKLTKGTDYTVSYGTNKNTGEGTVTIKGKGDYSGTVVLHFTIKPAKQKITKLTAGKEKIRVNWKKTSQASGYVIYYATNSSFSNKSKIVVTDKTASNQLITGLTSSKTYYVKVESYKVVNGKKVIGKCSAVKKIKAK